MRPAADLNKLDVQRLENYRDALRRSYLTTESVKNSDVPYLQFEATLLAANILLEVRDELRKETG